MASDSDKLIETIKKNAEAILASAEKLAPKYDLYEIVVTWLDDILGVNYPDSMTKYAMRSWFLEAVCVCDFSVLTGSCEGRKSIHVNLKTMRSIEERLVEQSNEFGKWMVDARGKTIDPSSLLPKNIRDNDEFVEAFREYMEDQDDELETNLIDYFMIQGFLVRLRSDNFDDLPQEEGEFRHMNA